jgi:hypothetical protein
MSKKAEAFLQFLQAASNLAKQGVKKSEILKFAKLQFGKVTDEITKAVDNIFEKSPLEKILDRRKATKKSVEERKVLDMDGNVIDPNQPIIGGKQDKGITTLKTEFTPEQAAEDIFPSGDYKYDMDMAAESYVENNPEMFKNMLYEDLDQKTQMEVFAKVSKVISRKNAEKIKAKKNNPEPKPKGFQLNVEKFVQDFPVSKEEATRISKLPTEEQEKIIKTYLDEDFSQQVTLMDFEPPKDRKPNATGGRAGFYMGGQSGQSVIEPDLSDIGHGSDALMARTRLTAPGSQATTSTGLNYLLGEDNDNTRVPFAGGGSDRMMSDAEKEERTYNLMRDAMEKEMFLKKRREEMEKDKKRLEEKKYGVAVAEGGRIGFNDGLLVPPAKPYTEEMFEDDSMTLLKGMYGTGKDSNKFLYNEMIKKGNILRNQGVEKETVIEIIRNNKDKINAFLETQTTTPKTLKGLANGGRIGFQDGLNFDKAFEKMLEKETEEYKPVDISAEGEKILKEKFDSLTPNETEKEKKEREMFEIVKEFQTLKKKGMIRPDMSFRNFQKMKEQSLVKNKILELDLKYPEKEIIDKETNMVNKENLKSAIDEAEANLEISPIDGLTLKRSINTEGEQSVTSGSFDLGNLNFSSDNIEEGKLTSKGNFTFGGVDLSGMVDSNDGQILNTELGFNYDNALKGKMTNSDGYRSTELDLNKTFPINDNINLNLTGSADTQTFDGKTYRNSDLTPKLSYNDGIFNASIAKEIIGGGDKPNLGLGVNYNNFYAKGDDLLSKDRSGVIGYQKEFGDKDGDLFFTAGAEKNIFDDEYTGGVGLKYKFADGGIAGLRQGYSKGKGVDLARRGFLKILGGTVGAIAAFKSGALKLLGKTATTKAVPEVVKIAEGSGAPAWFEPMVNKVLADGLDITKKNATMDGQIVKSLDTPTGKVEVNYDTRSGSVDVNYSGENTAMGEGVDMRYVVGQADETTKVKPFDEFEAVETIPEGRMTGPDDYNVEFGENATGEVKNLFSDVSELQTLGGDKRLINDISVTLQKKKTLKQMNENPTEFASDNLPDYDPT